MKFGSGLASSQNGMEAVQAACTQALQELGEKTADVAVFFITAHYAKEYEAIRNEIVQQTRVSSLIGCTSEGIIGKGRELEALPAISILVGRLPGVSVREITIDQTTVEAVRDSGQWLRVLEVSPDENPVLILLPDPYTLDCMQLLEGLNQAYPAMSILGGMASAARAAGGNALFTHHGVFNEGAVGLILTGDISVRSVVSQGCRPIGQAMAVTSSDGNVIHTLAGEPALKVLERTFVNAPRKDQALARSAVFVGRVVDEYKERFERGDFLIRGVMGFDRDTGSLVVGDLIQTGETVQFHVRDAESAHEDLELMLERTLAGKEGPAGALIFSCNGRGSRLFTEKDHDAKTVKDKTGLCPQAGFFCAGEIGPISGRNFVHGFTSSIAFFYPSAGQRSVDQP